MTIPSDPLKLLRDYLYTNWSLTGADHPTKAEIGETGFTVHKKFSQITGLCVNVKRDTLDEPAMSTGDTPLRIASDYVVVQTWTKNPDQLHNMVSEVSRILQLAKQSCPTGIDDVDYLGVDPNEELLDEPQPVYCMETQAVLTYKVS